jgi:hypothetical protein
MIAMFRPARRLALAALLSCLALPALPQASGGYTVEIVVFRNGGEAAALPDSGARPVITGDDVSATTVSARKLGGAVSRLNGAGKRVIAHSAWRQGAASVRSRRGVSAAQLGLNGITGKVILERGTFLLLGIDLVVEDGGKRYRLQELRQQAKVNELQYFDHPAFGVLALVSAE